jgi:3'(2'), 5'-bisphosphate nucleotidase
MNMDEINLQRLCSIAQAAGQEIMAVYEQGGATWQKADTSPLTKADLRADQMIRQGLEADFPGVSILSEESRCQQDMPENPALR